MSQRLGQALEDLKKDAAGPSVSSMDLQTVGVSHAEPSPHTARVLILFARMVCAGPGRGDRLGAAERCWQRRSGRRRGGRPCDTRARGLGLQRQLPVVLNKTHRRALLLTVPFARSFSFLVRVVQTCRCCSPPCNVQAAPPGLERMEAEHRRRCASYEQRIAELLEQKRQASLAPLYACSPSARRP